MFVVNLCWVFFGVVVGNVKVEGICEIECYGFFEMYGDLVLMKKMD